MEVKEVNGIVEYHMKDAVEYPGAPRKWGLIGWPIVEGSVIWLTVDADSPYLNEGASFVIRDRELSKIIIANEKETEINRLDYYESYRCQIRKRVFYAIGWEGNTWMKFGLDDVRWIIEELYPNERLVRSEWIDDKAFDTYKYQFIKKRYDHLRPVIESKSGKHDYYLISDVHKCIKPCRACAKPVVNLWRCDEKPIEVGFWPYWDGFREMYEVTHDTVSKMQKTVPRWMRWSEHACSAECAQILRRRAGTLIRERFELWARQRHETKRIKNLKQMSKKLRNALKTNNQDALRLLKKEYELEATSHV